MAGAGLAFFAKGLPETCQRDESVFDRVNRIGTRNLLEAARGACVRRVVCTSTMAVFAAPRGGVVIEGPLDPIERRSAYESSKVAAQRDVDEAGREAHADASRAHREPGLVPSSLAVVVRQTVDCLLSQGLTIPPSSSDGHTAGATKPDVFLSRTESGALTLRASNPPAPDPMKRARFGRRVDPRPCATTRSSGPCRRPEWPGSSPKCPS